MTAAAPHHVARRTGGILKADWGDLASAGLLLPVSPRTAGMARLSVLATNGASDTAYDFKYLSSQRSGTEAV